MSETYDKRLDGERLGEKNDYYVTLEQLESAIASDEFVIGSDGKRYRSDEPNIPG